jgi:hypothetical protein
VIGKSEAVARPLTIASTVLIVAFATAGPRAQEAIPAGHHHRSGSEQRAQATTNKKAPKRKHQFVEHADHAAHDANDARATSTPHEGMPAMGVHGHDGSTKSRSRAVPLSRSPCPHPANTAMNVKHMMEV